MNRRFLTYLLLAAVAALVVAPLLAVDDCAGGCACGSRMSSGPDDPVHRVVVASLPDEPARPVVMAAGMAACAPAGRRTVPVTPALNLRI